MKPSILAVADAPHLSLPEVAEVPVREEPETPREKLARLGAGALTDAEILTLAMGWRSTAQAEALLAETRGLKALMVDDARAQARRAGITPALAARLQASLELGRRAMRAKEQRPRLRTPEEIFRFLAPSLSALRFEVFHILCFNSRNMLLSDERVATGTINACPVDPRTAFRAAVLTQCTAVVLAHNHPSGDPEPSGQDLSLTAHLIEAARVLGIKVLDHIIIGDDSYVSLLQRGEMPLLGADPVPNSFR